MPVCVPQGACKAAHVPEEDANEACWPDADLALGKRRSDTDREGGA